jgi:hypothetical protein
VESTTVNNQAEAVNLAECPSSILAADSNAPALWRVLIRKVGVTVSKGQHIEDRPAWMLRNFGVDDLANRLAIQQQREKGGPQHDIARAKMWRHVSEACLPGDSISDLTASNLYLLNAFIVPKDKRYASPFELRKESDKESHETSVNEPIKPVSNVSQEADAAFMHELERTDPKRHANLRRNMRQASPVQRRSSRSERAQQPDVRTEACSASQPEAAQHHGPVLHRGGRPKKHTSNAGKQRAYRNGLRNANAA